jgi:protein involved in sex pheromone biosynthesis
MKKLLIFGVCALVCLLNSCAIFVAENDQPSEHHDDSDTTTIVIIK